MIFKLAYRNIRKSIKDYGVYFFTVALGVAIFYVFNAIETQTAMMKISSDQREIIRLIVAVLSGVSVFVSMVLGFLIIYANQFLIKRRKKEFGIYLILGMTKQKVSFILFLETLMVGTLSLVTGLLLGSALSQIMGIAVANMFIADVKKFAFVFSMKAMIKTILYFGVMYLLVMIFNTLSISSSKIITLLRKQENEKIRFKNPIISALLLIAGIICSISAYYMVVDSKTFFKILRLGSNYGEGILIPIGLGIIATFLIFYSGTTIVLTILKHTKRYNRGLNIFTFKQLSSQMNTMVVSMSIICISLFITICMLSTAMTIRQTLNDQASGKSPADYCAIFYTRDKKDRNIPELLKKAGFDIDKQSKEYIYIKAFIASQNDMSYKALLGDKYKNYEKELEIINNAGWSMMSISDYNKVAKIYHHKQYTLNNEYMILTDYDIPASYQNKGLKDKPSLTINGYKLASKYNSCQNGFVSMDKGINPGILIVPDYVVSKMKPYTKLLIGNYHSSDNRKTEDQFKKSIDSMITNNPENIGGYLLRSKIENQLSSVGLSLLATFIGLYIGIVFLISSAAILALKALSHTGDSLNRYEILKRLGADDMMLRHSLFKQIFILFMIPLILAIIHSVAGIKFSMFLLTSTALVSAKYLLSSTLMIGALFLMIYGGYFFVTYRMSLHMLRESS